MVVENITQLVLHRFELRKMISNCMEELSQKLSAQVHEKAKEINMVYHGEIDGKFKIMIEDVVITFDTDQVNKRNGSKTISQENIRSILLEILSEGLGVVPITGL